MTWPAGIRGAKEMRAAAAQLRAEAKAMQRNINGATRRGLAGLEAEAKRTAARLPSGYRPTFIRSLHVKVKAWRLGAKVLIYASGVDELRDAAARNAGRMRHPVFGRSRLIKGRGRKSRPWVLQLVRAGFADDAVDSITPDIARQIGAEMDQMRRRLEHS